MNTSLLKKSLVFLAVFCLSSCIVVNDFDAYWDQGEMDTRLEERWENIQDGKAAIEFRWKDDQTYNVIYHAQQETRMLARTLKLTPHAHFMMMKEHPGKRGGILQAYVIQDDTLVRFDLLKQPSKTDAPEKTRLYRELQQVLDLPEIEFSRTYLTISMLTPEVIAALKKASSRPEFWVQSNVYRIAP